MAQSAPEHPTEEPGRAATLRLQIAVACVSATLLALQVAFTRVLSVVLHFHMVFFVLSVAMLGVGLPGAWLLWRPPGPRTAARAMLFATASIPAAVVALLRYGSSNTQHTLLVAMPCLAIPFLSLGTAAAALLIEARGTAFRRVYAADLLGGALGALGIIALLDVFPTPALVVGLAWVLAGAVVWFGTRREAIVAGLLSLGAVALVVAGEPLRVRFTKAYEEGDLGGRVIFERWSSTTRLAVFDRPFFYVKNTFFTWGPGKKAPRNTHREYWIEQDGGAGTPVMEFDGDLGKVVDLEYDVTSLGYHLRPAHNVLVVGPGGGRDLLTALRMGADRIRAVEINRGMVELMTGPLAEFSGHIYTHPSVQVEFAEARSFLARGGQRYDAIQISLIDSFTATAAGAHALSEGYLYTVEAARTFLRTLEPRGVLSITRWDGFESSRLLGTVSAALAAEGLEPVDRHIIAQRATNVVTVLASRTPFDEAEQRRASEQADAKGWTPVHPADPAAADCIASHGDRCRRAPATDDVPFFFIGEKAFGPMRGPNSGLRAIREVGFLSLLGMLLSVFLPLYRDRKTVSGSTLAAGAYYVIIGISFMFVEVGLSHRFVEYVGHPTTSASVVLTGLLVGAGVGSYVIPGMSGRSWTLATSLVIAAVGLGAPIVFEHTRALGPGARGLVAGSLALITAFPLGAWFPSGLGHFGEERKAWFWLVNGTAGVVGGILALGVAMDFGFRMVFLAAAALYGCAAALLRVPVGPQARVTTSS